MGGQTCEHQAPWEMTKMTDPTSIHKWKIVTRSGQEGMLSFAPKLPFHGSSVPLALQYSLNNIILISIFSWATCTKYHMLSHKKLRWGVE